MRNSDNTVGSVTCLRLAVMPQGKLRQVDVESAMGWTLMALSIGLCRYQQVIKGAEEEAEISADGDWGIAATDGW